MENTTLKQLIGDYLNSAKMMQLATSVHDQPYMKSILQQRFGECDEVANVVYFLASDEASLITGEIIYPTGGIL